MSNNIINNTSYTNKDFNSIYSELLDLVKKLTNKWDPSLSNESDPGVLLLKLNALIADKNNYNIDKNVLECFPSSVTQYGNARKLYESLGYKLGWYNSATTKISFQLKSVENIEDDEPVYIDTFSMVTDSTGEIVYTILKDVTLPKNPQDQKDKIVTVDAIQGTVHSYELNGSNEIALADLDENYRLYFEDTHIAQNGIFLKGVNDPNWFDWTCVDNIVSYPSGEKVYEFGVLPNSNTCYIQFPEDVASLLVDSSFELKYIVSLGEQGNIKANVVDSFLNDISYKKVVITEQIRVSQPNATTNGSDPEDLTSAYNNYKRTIGTFSTLVTNRDYNNYIYNIKNDTGSKYLISNCVITDRANDINVSNYVQTWTPAVKAKELIIRDKNGTAGLNAFNLCLYLYGNSNDIVDDDTYAQSFLLNTDPNTRLTIETDELDDVKAIEHDIIEPKDLKDRINLTDGVSTAIKLLYNNLYKLNGQLITYNKVTKDEADDIAENVKSMLYQKYSARQVDFGKEIDYSALIEDILGADDRISNVILQDLNYSTKVQNADTGSTLPLQPLTDDEKNEIIARMVLAGNVQLFKVDDLFSYEFGQTGGVINGKVNGSDLTIKSITTNANIEFHDTVADGQPAKSATVKENEMVQFYAPNYIDVKEYSTYVKYRFVGEYSYLTERISVNTTTKLLAGSVVAAGSIVNGSAITSATRLTSTATLKTNDVIAINSAIKYGSTVNNAVLNSIEIPANTDYEIRLGEYLSVSYTDSNNLNKVETLGPGTVINSNIVIGKNAPTSSTSTTVKMVQAGEYIRVKELNKDTIPAQTQYYFITKSNKLSLSANEEYMLKEEEYFIYTDSSTTELMLLGSGTMLKPTSAIEAEVANIDYKSIEKGDTSKIEWLRLPCDVIVQEMSIVTVGEGGEIQLLGANVSTLTNDPQEIKASHIEIAIGSQFETLKPFPKGDGSGELGYWKGHSRLNLNVTATNPQKLLNNQTVTLKFNDDSLSSITNKSILFNTPVVISGGKDIDMSVLNLSTKKYNYSLKAYVFDIASGYTYKRNSVGTIEIKGSASKTVTLPFTFTTSNSNKENSWLIPVHLNLNTSGVSVSFYAGNTQIGTFESNNKTFTSSGSYTLGITTSGNLSGFKIVFSSNAIESDIVQIGSIVKLAGYNAEEIDSGTAGSINDYSISSNGSAVLTKIDSILKNSKTTKGEQVMFDWTYQVSEEDKVVQPILANSFFNTNHICNKFTLAEVDFDNYSIVVNKAYIT